MSDDPPAAAAAGIVTLLTLGAGFGFLAAGWPYFWIAFPIGFGGLLPASVAVVQWYSNRTHDESTVSDGQDALAALRERYTRGEIDEREFERRVERVLETESVSSAQAAYADDETGPEYREGNRSPERDRETERL